MREGGNDSRRSAVTLETLIGVAVLTVTGVAATRLATSPAPPSVAWCLLLVSTLNLLLGTYTVFVARSR